MQSSSYWDRVLRRRMTRRRAVAGTAGLSATAMFLMACGGDDDDDAPSPTATTGTTGSTGGTAGSTGATGATGSTGAAPTTTTSGSSGLLHTPSAVPGKPGGTLKHYSAADATHFDSVADSAAAVVSLSSSLFYPRMLRMKSVAVPEEADGSSEGEAAEAWEVSPDRLSITFKLRQGMVWDRRDPTNGRQIDADDVVFSWEKYKELNPNSAAMAYQGGSSQSPVESVTATDAETIVVKLAQPDASIIPMFSAYDLFYIQPKEADGDFDPRQTVRGHGLFILDEYVPSSHFTWAKNPDFYIKDHPFPDKVEVPIVSDYAQRLAQFKAGNIYTDILETVQEDIIVTKQDVPDTLLLQENNYPTSSTAMTTFGWEADVPFLDVRVRQALSMMIDREAIIDVLDNRENFEKEGLATSIRRVSAVPGGWTGYWLDPTDEASFGPEAKYLNFNLDEATALMSAAGYPDGLEFDLYQGPPGRYGAAYERQVELYDGMFRNAGQKPKLSPITNSDDWLTNYSRVYRTNTYEPGAGFNGIAVIPERGYVTVALQLYNQFHKNGGGYRGVVPEGGSVLEGDPALNDLTEKIKQEFDTDAQIDLVHDLIRYTAENMYYIPRASSAKTFTLWWPAVGNAGAYAWYANSGVWVDRRREWWVDESKAPLA